MHVERRPQEAFDTLPLTPVAIRPFDPASKRAALAYGERLNDLLEPTGVSAELFGSVELEIAGKGEWEFALYPSDAQWYPTLILLVNHYQGVYAMSDEFVLFEDVCEGHPIEVIVMRGGTAARNRAIMRYWREHPAARAAYEEQKYRHCHAKRDYYRWKERFIADILESL